MLAKTTSTSVKLTLVIINYIIYVAHHVIVE